MQKTNGDYAFTSLRLKNTLTSNLDYPFGDTVYNILIANILSVILYFDFAFTEIQRQLLQLSADIYSTGGSSNFNMKVKKWGGEESLHF